MPNQMIALQARNPQLPDPARQTAQFANFMNMARQQEAAQRQAQQAQQTMDINAAQEARAARLAEPQFAKAQAEAAGADIDTKLKFQAFVYTALKNADSPDQVVGFAERIASQPQFKDALFQGALSDAVASMPTDPVQFDAWRKTTAAKTLTAAQQLEQDYIKQTTGTEERLISVPKFGGGGATEVPGSRIQVAEGMQYVKDDQGNVFAVPKEKPGSFGTPSPTAGAPGKGGVAAALQTNPGALKDGAFARSQPGYAGASGGFATFKTPEDGARAQENLLRTAYVNKGFNTIDKIINRYAPQGPENSAASVSNYKKYVARQTGIDMSAPIAANQIPAVAKAMREFETGQTQGRGTAAGPTPVIKGTAPAKARSAALGAKSKYDNTIAVARRLLKNPALNGILGNIQGNIPDTALSVVSQDAADALSDYNNLLTIAGFQELQTMRDNSPTGGALGQVSDSENKMLQQSAFASSRTQSEAKFRRSLLDYIARLEGSRDRVLRAYEDQFGERLGGGGKAPAKPAAGKKTSTSTLSAETRAKYGL